MNARRGQAGLAAAWALAGVVSGARADVLAIRVTSADGSLPNAFVEEARVAILDAVRRAPCLEGWTLVSGDAAGQAEPVRLVLDIALTELEERAVHDASVAESARGASPGEEQFVTASASLRLGWSLSRGRGEDRLAEKDQRLARTRRESRADAATGARDDLVSEVGTSVARALCRSSVRRHFDEAAPAR